MVRAQGFVSDERGDRAITSNLELTAYITVIFLSSFIAMRRDQTTYTRQSFFAFAASYFLLCYFSRMAGLDGDFRNYVANLFSFNLDFHYTREPYIWLGTRPVFWLTRSPEWTFLIFDMIAGVMTYIAFKAMSAPKYALYSFACFFPFILGQQNVLRQWHAAILVLLALALFRAGRRSYPWPLLISPLAHNVAVIFWPVVFAGSQKLLHRLAFYFGLGMVPVALIMGKDTKSGTATGANLSMAYISVLAMFLILYCLLSKLKLKGRKITDAKLLFAAVLITFASYFVISSAGSERVGMFSLMLIYPILAVRIEDLGTFRTPMRVLFANAGFWPIFMFSSRDFLLPWVN